MMEGQCPKCGRQLNTAGACAYCINNDTSWFTPNKVVDVLIREGRKGYDNVRRPSHYCEGREIEPKDVMLYYDPLSMLIFAMKYIARCGRKDEQIQELMKAKQYIQFLLDYDEKKIKKYSIDEISDDWNLPIELQMSLMMISDILEKNLYFLGLHLTDEDKMKLRTTIKVLDIYIKKLEEE